MEFNITSGHPEKQRTACLIVGVFEPRRLSHTGEQIDQLSDGYLSKLLRRGDMEGRRGQVLLLHDVPHVLADRILLIGCGKERELSDEHFQAIIRKSITVLNETGSMDAVSFLTELNVKGRDIHWKLRQTVEHTHQALYVFDKLKTKQDNKRRPLRRITISVSSRADLPKAEAAVKRGQAISEGVSLCKDLGNLPGNICTPSYLAEQAQTLAATFDKIDTVVLEKEEMEALGMGALLSVARGSKQPPKLIRMTYNNAPAGEKPVILVGKGITFDSGGLSLKSPQGMIDMKYDMCGGASVLGVMQAVAQLNLPIHLMGIVPATENLVNGQATKPSDIVTSLSGQTIEILNTDAEGRLILCDALTYCEQFNPAVVIDIATLTGAILMALGHANSGLFSNHDPLAHDLSNAAKQASDLLWRLPIGEPYDSNLDSTFADIRNIGKKPIAGSITAACFLSRFTKKFHWAHLDVAGTAFVDTPTKGATGRPVPLLTQYLINYAQRS